MTKNEYEKKLKECLDLDSKITISNSIYVYANNDDLITLALKKEGPENFSLVCNFRSDFSDENFEREKNFIEKCINLFLQECKNIDVRKKISDINKDFE